MSAPLWIGAVQAGHPTIGAVPAAAVAAGRFFRIPVDGGFPAYAGGF
jgi:hypothetical protein